MKIIKTASDKKALKISKKEWSDIGKKSGWIKEASQVDQYLDKIMNELSAEHEDPYPYMVGTLQAYIINIASQIEAALTGHMFVSSVSERLGIAENLQKISDIVRESKSNTTNLENNIVQDTNI